MKYLYTAVFERDKNSEKYYCRVPDLPGCITTGDGLDNAIDMITDAASGWLVVAEDEGNDIPAATPQNELCVPRNAILSIIRIDTVAYRSACTCHMRDNDFYSRCQSCSSICSDDAWENDLYRQLIANGIEVTEKADGLFVKNSFDSWLVSICDMTYSGNAVRRIRLWHGNLYSRNNGNGGESMPGMHEQFCRDITVEELVNYIIWHVQKYNSGEPF